MRPGARWLTLLFPISIAEACGARTGLAPGSYVLTPIGPFSQLGEGGKRRTTRIVERLTEMGQQSVTRE